MVDVDNYIDVDLDVDLDWDLDRDLNLENMDTENKHLKNITTIIFDLGGVLVDWNPEYLFLKRFNGDAKKTKWFLENVCTQEWNIMQDAGRSIAEANRLTIATYPEYEADIIAFLVSHDEFKNLEISSEKVVLDFCGINK